MVEAATALAAVALALTGQSGWTLAAYAWWTATMIVLVFVDLAAMLLPLRISITSTAGIPRSARRRRGPSKAATWRIRLAHNRVIRQSMQAAEHIGLATSPTPPTNAKPPRCIATLYGVVDATSPEAVAGFNAWRLDDAITAGTPERAETGPATGTAADAFPPVCS